MEILESRNPNNHSLDKIDYGAAAYSSYSFIGAGGNNCISATATYSFIGGGGGAAAAAANYITGNNSFIGAGEKNCVIAHCSSIMGGCNNTICGDYSAILGGSGNTVPAGFSYVGIFGQNINNPLNMSNNTLHVNGLNANSIPGPGGLGLPSGTIFWDAPGMPWPKALYIV